MVDELCAFLVVYRYVPDMDRRRSEHRDDHLDWLRDLADAGRLVLAGAVLDPLDSAVIVIRAQDLYDVRRTLLDDPYARANLITEVTTRPLGLAVGG